MGALVEEHSGHKPPWVHLGYVLTSKVSPHQNILFYFTCAQNMKNLYEPKRNRKSSITPHTWENTTDYTIIPIRSRDSRSCVYHIHGRIDL